MYFRVKLIEVYLCAEAKPDDTTKIPDRALAETASQKPSNK